MLDRARPQQSDDRLVRLVAGIKAAAPDRTLQQIAAQLEAMRERTPRGGTRWHPSSVKHLLTRAERLGLTEAVSCSRRVKFQQTDQTAKEIDPETPLPKGWDTAPCARDGGVTPKMRRGFSVTSRWRYAMA